MLKVDENNHIFHLFNEKISLVIQILDNHFVVNRYFGRRIPFFAGSNTLDDVHHAFSVFQDDDRYSATNLSLEYSYENFGDYRITSSSIRDVNGYPIGNYEFLSYDTTPIFPKGMPHVRNNEDTTYLNLELTDKETKTNLILHYLLVNDAPILTKWVTMKNQGDRPVTIDKLDSLQVDISRDDYKLLSFSGAHAKEFQPQITQIENNIQEISSNRGVSSPQHQPFVALIDKDTSLDYGEYYASSFIWSGDFKAQVEKDQYNHLRMTMGVNADTLKWELSPKETFETPQAIICYGKNGLNGISKNFQTFFKKHLLENRLVKSPLIPLNTWEASYFGVNADLCKELMPKAAETGINLFVIDDGWFINRNSEKGQLGDWKIDKEKFPNGLEEISRLAHTNNMKFGLWIEPEMITTNSDLFKKHPDWVMNNPKRPHLLSRNQLILDLSNNKVQKYLIETISNLVKENHIDYIKWDFNRQFAPTISQTAGSTEQETVDFKYIKGLYHVLERIRKINPDLIIENCASGGGRVDPGMLYYTDQTWISDLTDSVSRFRIISNMLMLYPLSVFSSHLSKSPNEQDGRMLPLNTRLLLSGIGSFGVELNLNEFNATELKKLKRFIKEYKTNYNLVHNGIALNMFCLTKDETKPIAILLSKENKYSLIYSYGKTDSVNIPKYLPLRYLEENKNYLLNGSQEISGVELNDAGLTIEPIKGDYQVKKWDVAEIKQK